MEIIAITGIYLLTTDLCLVFYGTLSHSPASYAMSNQPRFGIYGQRSLDAINSDVDILNLIQCHWIVIPRFHGTKLWTGRGSNPSTEVDA